MAIDPGRICINRKIAPALNMEAFFQLVQKLGLNKVELRNDMNDGSVTDDLSHQQVNVLAKKYGMEIITINAIYPFNVISGDLLARVGGLLKDAKGTGAKALVMCPLNDGTPVSADDTVSALRMLAPLFDHYGIKGLVEPLGFPTSSLRSAGQALRLIDKAEVPFTLVLDTFHHYLYEGAEQDFAAGLDVSRIGLVHLSGVEDDRETHTLTDEQRIMLSEGDRLKSLSQVQRLEQLGYTGIYAFEPFASCMNSWTAADIEREIRHSIAVLQG